MKLLIISLIVLLVGFFVTLLLLQLNSATYESECENLYKIYKKEKSTSDYPPEFVEKYSANFIAIRRDTFMKNCLQVQAHNSDPNKSYMMGINQFSDWVSVVRNEQIV